MHTHTSLIDNNWEFVHSLFPKNWEATAMETKAAVRFTGGVDNLPDLMRIFLIHLAGGFSLEETAVRACLAGLGQISDVALMKRLQKAEELFHQMCLSLIAEREMPSVALKGMKLKLVDATHIKESGKTGSEWRLHHMLTLPELQCDHFELTPVKGVGNGETFCRFPVSPDDCVLGDRAYATIRNVEYVSQAQGKVVVRMNLQSLPLYSLGGDRFNILEMLKTITKPGKIGEWTVVVNGKKDKVTGRLCVIRKTEDEICKSHKKLRRRAQKRQNKIKPETWEVAKYVMVFTTLLEADWSTSQILELYRWRWQIELAFKRFKSLADLGQIPKFNDKSARAWLYGKLFICLLTEKLVAQASFFSPWGLIRSQAKPRMEESMA